MRRQSHDTSNSQSKKKFGDRRKPFSHAKKKEFMKEKRKRKKEKLEREMKEEEEHKYQGENEPKEWTSEEIKNRALETIEKSFENQDRPTRLYTVFDKESKEEIEMRIKDSLLPLKKNEEYHPWNLETIEMPKRPNWNKDMSPEELDEHEKNYFKNYVAHLYEKYHAHRLNYFEHNLEVWRQLWRTLEISNICLLIADSRHPLFHFPVSLYKHVTEELKKPLIFVLNKADLISREKLQNWVNWFNEKFPKLIILTFTSFLSKDEHEKKQKRNKKEVDRDLVYKIWDTCEDISMNQLKLPKAKEYWKELRETLKQREEVEIEKNEEEREHVTDMITIGLIGHPNVGKSCILNGLVGKTIASTSYTPGHTKHIQTYFVSKHVRLCDSPGLVFPCLDMPKELQIVCGTYPIAQTREPYSAIRCIAERIDLVDLLKLKLPEDFEYWSPYAICTAYAMKRGYISKRGGRPDVYRAGNEILRFTLFGKILLAFDSPNTKDYIEVKEDLLKQTNKQIKKQTKKQTKKQMKKQTFESSDDEGEDYEFRDSNPFDILDEIDL